MRTLSRLWSTFESVPGLSGVLAEWRELLGDEFHLVKPLLKSTGKRSRSYPCPSPGGPGCPREVVEYHDGSIVAVCGDHEEVNCDDVPLSLSDVLVHTLDRRKLAGWVARALGIEDGFSQVDGSSETWRVGDYAPYVGKRFPVFLLLAFGGEQRSEAVQRLCRIAGGPFMLAVPTADTLSSESKELLRERGGRFLTLGGLLVDSGDGRIVIASAAGEIVAAFHAEIFPPSETTVSAPMFPTPPGTVWSGLRMRFIDGERLTVFCGGLEETYNFSQMGMVHPRSAEPTKQWDLLRDLAYGHGVHEVRTKKEIAVTSTRKKRLNQTLTAFFGIQGEAIHWDRTDSVYRTRFPISHA